MNIDDFRMHFEQLSDLELTRLLTEQQTLVQDAVEALKQEIQKRDLFVVEPSQLTQQPIHEVGVECLEGDDLYRALCEKKNAIRRYWFLIAMGPFVLWLVVRNSFFEEAAFFTCVTLLWSAAVTIYGLILYALVSIYPCPKCSHRFGREDCCPNCGFPRTRETIGVW